MITAIENRPIYSLFEFHSKVLEGCLINSPYIKKNIYITHYYNLKINNYTILNWESPRIGFDHFLNCEIVSLIFI